MYTLGKYRKIIDDEEKSKYQKLFKSYFLKSFSSRLVDYTNPRINVVSQKKINEKYTIVNSVLEATSKRPQVKIDWRIYTKNPDFLYIFSNQFLLEVFLMLLLKHC